MGFDLCLMEDKPLKQIFYLRLRKKDTGMNMQLLTSSFQAKDRYGTTVLSCRWPAAAFCRGTSINTQIVHGRIKLMGSTNGPVKSQSKLNR